MSIELNQTIVFSRDKRVSAEFLTDLFGLPSPTAWGPFLAVAVSNAVTLDFLDTTDEIFGRIQSGGHAYWADPGHREPAAAASTSTTRAGTTSRSSPGHTATNGKAQAPMSTSLRSGCTGEGPNSNETRGKSSRLMYPHVRSSVGQACPGTAA